MTQFKSWRSYWDFQLSVRNNARYVRPPEVEEFLSLVRETGAKRVHVINAGEHLFRAQLGCDVRKTYVGEVHFNELPGVSRAFR